MPRRRESASTRRRRAPRAERLDVEALAKAQGVTPVTSPEELAGDFWPEGESTDDFIATIRKWRREGTVNAGNG